MSNKGYKEIISAAVNDSDIFLSDIPEIDLYIDQIISLIEDKYKDNKRSPKDKLLTKTMINNYSKEGIIKPIKGKKYSRAHIIQMLMIYSMKNTLTIKEIKEVFDSGNFDKDSLIKCYVDFIEDKSKIREMTKEMVTSFMEEADIDLEEDSDKLFALLGITAMSSYMKNIAQRIVDEYCMEGK
ncbi:MAG: DUF1836 domain-containing protein [Clostridiales bacterium]|jgi:hypothetical protein|nr:DUF1836 domain-containing protein [Clostridiales bacterium]